MGTPSPELKQLWIRVLKRVHPDLAIDEQDRVRCERLTKLANEAYQAGDEEALRAVLRPSQPAGGSGYRTFLPLTPFSFKQLLSVAIAVVILIGTGFSLYSATTSRHAVTNSPTAQVVSVKAPIQAHVEVSDAGIRQPRPSTVAGTTVGASAYKSLPVYDQRASLVGLLMSELSAESRDIARMGKQRQSGRCLRLLP